MKNVINVFSRHEIKYILSADQRREVLKGIKDHMIPDPHGMSTIRNVYYDTPDYRLIRKSLEKPEYKEKIRVRSYVRPTNDSIVFLELKKKYKGVVYKRRIELPESAVEEYLDGKLGLDKVIAMIEEQNEKSSENAEKGNPQIAKEIDYFKNFYKNLRPMVYLSYDRCAYFSEEDESLRITFDKNIRWRGTDVSLKAEVGGETLLEDGESLMEIKTATALPIWLVEVLSEAGARPASFSKYGNAYRAINERKGKTNDKYIFKHIYREFNSNRIYNQYSGGFGARRNYSAGLFVSHSAF